MPSRKARRQKQQAARNERRVKEQTLRKPDQRAAKSAVARHGDSQRVQVTGWRRWRFRLAAMTVVPVLFFAVLELGLRAFGYGYPTGFFVRIDGRDGYTTNQQFGWRFFPPAIARVPAVCELPADKADNGYRVFVLGSSAAMGTPEPAFGFARMLKAMLEGEYPRGKFEVVNAAMTAVNSHVVLPIARDCAHQNADLFVVYMGNNEVVGPYGCAGAFARFSPKLSAIRASIAVKTSRIAQLLEQGIRRWAKQDETFTEWKGMETFAGNRVAFDDPRLQKVYSHFRANLAEICDLAGKSRAKIILCTVATNLKDSAPFASLHRTDLTESDRAKWEETYAAAIASAEAGEHAEAVQKFLRAASIDDCFADLHFRLGHCLLALKQFDKAREHFMLARDLDALRFRADTQINRIIREVAAQRAAQGVYLVDVERAFEESDKTQYKIPGEELFYEHVHMNPEGNYLLAEAVFQQIAAILPDYAQKGALSPAAAPSAERCFELIALTRWDQYRMERDISEMQDKPPFTSQLDYAQRRALRQEKLEKLKAEGTSPAALQDGYRGYLAALGRDPEDSEIRRSFAGLLLERRDYEGAAEQWRILLARFPEIAKWHMELGEVLQAQAKPTEAIAEFREVMRINPAVAWSVYFNIGTVFLQQGKLPDAAEQFRRALAIHPRLAKAHNSLGAVLYQQGNLTQAIEHYGHALKLDSQLASAHNNLGCALAKQGKLPEAIEHYRQALQIDPWHLDVYHNLASALRKQGKAAEATDQFRQAARMAPESADAQYWLGSVLAAESRIREAADAYRQALRIDPGHLRAGHNLGVALTQLGETADAIDQYRRVLERTPDSLPTLNNLARILATHENPEFRNGPEAVRLMKQACERTAYKDPQLLDTLAAAYAEAGQFESALAAARSALQFAQAQRERDLIARIEFGLSIYKNRQPFRERPARTDP